MVNLNEIENEAIAHIKIGLSVTCPKCFGINVKLFVFKEYKKIFADSMEKAIIGLASVAGLTGGAGGAIAGAAAGAILGPIGSIIGGIVGACVGGGLAGIPVWFIAKKTADILSEKAVRTFFIDHRAFFECEHCGHRFTPD